MAGLTPTGFVIKTLDEIRAELETALRAAFGPDVDVSPTSVFGQAIGVFSSPIAQAWEVMQAIDASKSPDGASGASLDALASLTGATRIPASRTLLVDLELSGAPNALIAAGTVFRSPGGDLFDLIADVALDAGGFAGGFESGVNAQAQQTGPIFVGESSYLEVVTPGTTLTQVLSDYSAVVGRDVETDAAFRLRRVLSLSRSGDATLDAIRADVLAVPNVVSATVYENVQLTTDASGLPGKSIEVVLDDGGLNVYEQNARIAQAIFDSKSAGIRSYGTSSGFAQDASVNPVQIQFSRVEEVAVDVYVEIEAVRASFPPTSLDEIRRKVTAYIRSLKPGQDVFIRRLYDPVFEVVGVQDVPALEIGFHEGNTFPVNFAITPRQKIAVENEDDIYIDVTYVDPT